MPSFIQGIENAYSVTNFRMGCVMRMGNYFRLPALLISFLFVSMFSSLTFAVDYGWSYKQVTYPTPTAACQANVAYNNENSASYTYTLKSVVKVNETVFGCVQSRKTKPEGFAASDTTQNISRVGTTCPAGTSYNSTTGICVAPIADGSVCEDQSAAQGDAVAIYDNSVGKCVPFPNAAAPALCKYASPNLDNKAVYSIPGNVDKAGNATAPPTFVPPGMNCQMKTVTTSKCVINTDGTATCAVTATFTGETGTGLKDVADTSCKPGDECSSPVPETTNEEKPCNYASDSSGNLSCVSDKEIETQGTQNCGTFNGQFDCYTTKPTKNGISIATNIKTTTNADNTTTTTKTDVATKTTCTDIKTCSTTTSTTTTVIHKDSNGNTTGTSTTCTGKCNSSGGGLSTGDVDGSGSGDGEGDGEGDGGGGDWYEPGEDTYLSVMTKFKDDMAKAPIITGVSGFLSVNPSGSCPVYQIDAWVFHAQLDQWCGNTFNWAFIRAIILAVAAFMAFRIAFL